MINLFKLHLEYLFSMKIILISFVIIGCSMIGFLLFSNFYVSEQLLRYYHEDYFRDYLFDGVNFIKILAMFYALFLVINGYVLNKYDVYLITRISKKRLIITKLGVLLLGNVFFLGCCFMIFLITPLYLTPYVNTKEDFLILFFKLTLFSSYYLILFVLVYQVFDNMYGLLIVLIGYFISNFTGEYYIDKTSLNGFSQLINGVFLDIGYYQVVGFDFYYGTTYTMIVMMIVFLIFIILSDKSDILI